MSLPVVVDAPDDYEDPLDLMDEIDQLKKDNDASVLAHFYVDGDIQDIADFTGDSLKLARDATKVETSTIVFSGVHFMGESAKIMNPEKRVLIPDMLAGCSLAESCPADQLKAFQDQLRESGRQFDTVAYINTSAAVKSLCDWIVTSGNAREIIDRVPSDREILFVPDQQQRFQFTFRLIHFTKHDNRRQTRGCYRIHWWKKNRSLNQPTQAAVDCNQWVVGSSDNLITVYEIIVTVGANENADFKLFIPLVKVVSKIQIFQMFKVFHINRGLSMTTYRVNSVGCQRYSFGRVFLFLGRLF